MILIADIEIRELTEPDYGEWDSLVARSPHGTVFHNSHWIGTCSRLIHRQLKIYAVYENGRLIGGCSLFVYRKGPFRIASSTAQMTPYGGLVLQKPATTKVREQEHIYNEIMASLARALSAEHFDCIKLVNSPEFTDVRPFIRTGWREQVHYAYYFPLETSIEHTISKGARATIRDALNHGLTTEKLTWADAMTHWPTYWQQFVTTYSRQKLRPPVEEHFLKTMVQSLYDRQSGEVWIAKMPTSQMAAGEIIVSDNRRTYRWSPVSDTVLRKTGAASLLLYEILRDLKHRGVGEINLMGGNVPQLSHFLTAFNPRLVPYYEVSKMTSAFRLSLGVYRHLGGA